MPKFDLSPNIPRTAFVSGAAGQIGSAVVDELLENHIKVIAVDKDNKS